MALSEKWKIDIFFKLRWLWVSFIFHKSYKIWIANPSKLPYDVLDPLKMGGIYPSSYKHRSKKWVPPKIVAFQFIAIFLTEPWLWDDYGRKSNNPCPHYGEWGGSMQIYSTTAISSLRRLSCIVAIGVGLGLGLFFLHLRAPWQRPRWKAGKL